MSSGKITDFLLPYSGNFCGRKLLQSGEKRRFLWIARWCHQIMPCPQISRRICHTESNRSWMGAGIVAINCNLWSLITLVSSPDLIRTGVGLGLGPRLWSHLLHVICCLVNHSSCVGLSSQWQCSTYSLATVRWEGTRMWTLMCGRRWNTWSSRSGWVMENICSG